MVVTYHKPSGEIVDVLASNIQMFPTAVEIYPKTTTDEELKKLVVGELMLIPREQFISACDEK